MKKAYRANKSKEIFYVDYEGEQEVTLRNPMTGVVKTIKGTTLKRSYTQLTQEELKMEHETIATEPAVAEVALNFRELLNCETKEEFEAKLETVAQEKSYEDIDAAEDVAGIKKILGNARLTFRENMARYLKGKASYFEAVAQAEARPEDLDLLKARTVEEGRMQRYVDKMVTYFEKIEYAHVRIEALTPVAEPEAEETQAE